MTDKEKKFSDFEAGEIELGGDDLMKYLSSSYMKPNDVGSTVSKIIDREGLKALAKQLSIVKNTGSNTPEGDMIIKGLNSLIDAKLASLQTNPTGKYEEYIKTIKSLIDYSNLLEIIDLPILNIDAFVAQYKRYNFDFSGALEAAQRCHKQSPNAQTTALIDTITKEIDEIESADFDIDNSNFFNRLLGNKSGINNEKLKKKARDLIEEPIELAKLLKYYDRKGYTELLDELIADIFKYAHYEGTKNNDWENMIIDLNILIFIRPDKASLYGGRAFAKQESGDVCDAKKDIDKALEVEPDYDDEFIIGIIKKKIDAIFSSTK